MFCHIEFVTEELQQMPSLFQNQAFSRNERAERIWH